MCNIFDNVDKLRQWTSKNCPTEEEIAHREAIRHQVAGKFCSVCSNKYILNHLPLTITAGDCGGELEMVYAMEYVSKFFANHPSIVVVYAKPEYPDGTIRPQFTITTAAEKFKRH